MLVGDPWAAVSRPHEFDFFSVTEKLVVWWPGAVLATGMRVISA